MARNVAVAVLFDEQGRFLMSKRPANKPLPNLWEFPGGKVERSETALDAVIREVREEIGVSVDAVNAEEWFAEEVSYGSFDVHVHFFTIRRWQGQVRGCEGQEVRWESFPLQCRPVLKGTWPALHRIAAQRGLGAQNALLESSAPLVEVACADRLQLGEGPVWCAPYLIYCDILGHALHALHVDTKEHHVIAVPGPVSCIIPRHHRANSYVIAIADAIALLDEDLFPFSSVDWPKQAIISLSNIARASFPSSVPMRYNDGKADPAGRLWIGSMDLISPHGPHSALYSLDAPSMHLTSRVSEVFVSNGLAWHGSPSGVWTMYWVDTDTQTVWAFNYSLDSGDISQRRAAVVIDRALGRPDGMCIDTEGMLWVALLSGGAVGRFDPRSGKLLQRIVIPGASLVTSVCFGGPSMCDLYVTTGTWKLTREALEGEANAGRLMVIRNAASGRPPDTFAG